MCRPSLALQACRAERAVSSARKPAGDSRCSVGLNLVGSRLAIPSFWELPMSLVPHRFLFRVAYPCRYVKGIPAEDADRLLDLPESCRIDNFAAMDEGKNFADVRLAWNEFGLALQLEVKGKEQLAQGSSHQLRGSDGVTLWI